MGERASHTLSRAHLGRAALARSRLQGPGRGRSVGEGGRALESGEAMRWGGRRDAVARGRSRSGGSSSSSGCDERQRRRRRRDRDHRVGGGVAARHACRSERARIRSAQWCGGPQSTHGLNGRRSCCGEVHAPILPRRHHARRHVDCTARNSGSSEAVREGAAHEGSSRQAVSALRPHPCRRRRGRSDASGR